LEKIMTANVSVELLELWIDHSKYDGCSDGDADCLSAQKLLEAIQSGALTAPAEVNAEGLPAEPLLLFLAEQITNADTQIRVEKMAGNEFHENGWKRERLAFCVVLDKVNEMKRTRANDGGRGGG
jgi:hypothetical protein